MKKEKHQVKNKFLKKAILLMIIIIWAGVLNMSCLIANTEDDTMPKIISTTYGTEELVVADVMAKSPAYPVDATGARDSTLGIQNALLDCYYNGGGTVYLPKGKYKVTGNIMIPPFTALRGDYNDPDGSKFNGEYGTVIYADVAVSEDNFPSLFSVGGSSAVIGLTVFYPKQDAANVKPYPYTFEIPSFASANGHADHMAPTIRNITLINSYKGICASITPKGTLISAANEQIHLENIKGTVLMKGAELYNSSEYGVVRNITFNNSYWANAVSYMKPPVKEKIDQFTKKYGLGLQMGDLEWVQFSNISLADYKIGVRLFDGLRRHIAGQPEIYFIGQFYRLNISNTTTAVRVDNMFPNFGVTFAECNLEGSVYSIHNEDLSNSLIKLVDTALRGSTNGVRIQRSGGDSTYKTMKNSGQLPDSAIPVEPKPGNRLFNVVTGYGADKTGQYDCSQAIQNALDDAREKGGGIVYLPAGYYRVTKALTVYKNTELRGCGASASRDEIGMSKGTLIFANYGYTDQESSAKTGTALITLRENNAGVRGLRIIYPENEPDTSTGAIRLHSYTIRGMANSNYVINASLAGSTYGIEFKGTSSAPLQNPMVRNVSGTYYRQGISMTYTTNGHIEEALSNATVVGRNGLVSIFPKLFSSNWPSDENGKIGKVYDLITRPNSHFIVVNESSNLTIGNSFTFASKKVVTSVNSSVKIYNSAGDNLYPSGGALFDITGGSLTGVNLMRYSGTALINNGGSVNLFNRISLLENTDKDIVSNKEIEPSAVTGSSQNVDDLPLKYSYVAKADSQGGSDNNTSSGNAGSDSQNTTKSNNGTSKNGTNNSAGGNGEKTSGTSGQANNSSGSNTPDSHGNAGNGGNGSNTPASVLIPVLIAAGALIIAGAGTFGFVYMKKKKKKQQ